MYMGDIGDGDDLHIALFRMLHAERLVESQLADAEFSVELCHRLLELCRVRCRAKFSAQVTDPVLHPSVEDFAASGHIFIIHEHLDALRLQTLLQFCKVIVEQFLEDGEVMERDLVDASVHLAHDLAGRTVRVLVVHEKEGKICMPQVSLKSMTHRKLQQSVHALKEQAP